MILRSKKKLVSPNESRRKSVREIAVVEPRKSSTGEAILPPIGEEVSGNSNVVSDLDGRNAEDLVPPIGEEIRSDRNVTSVFRMAEFQQEMDRLRQEMAGMQEAFRAQMQERLVEEQRKQQQLEARLEQERTLREESQRDQIAIQRQLLELLTRGAGTSSSTASSSTSSSSSAAKTDFSKVMAKPQVFEGISDYSKCRDWLSAVSDYYEILSVDDDKRLKILTTLFTGLALSWWNENRHTITTWGEFEEAFCKRWIPPNDAKIAFDKLLKYEQRNQLAQQYYNEINELMIRSAKNFDQDDKIDMFIRGLLPETKKEVERAKYLQPTMFDSMEKVLQFVQNMEYVTKTTALESARKEREEKRRRE